MALIKAVFSLSKYHVGFLCQLSSIAIVLKAQEQLKLVAITKQS